MRHLPALLLATLLAAPAQQPAPTDTTARQRPIVSSEATSSTNRVPSEARSLTSKIENPYSVYNRPIHISYALRQGKVLKQTDAEILAAIDSVPNGVTCVTPFLLNVDDPSKYAPMLNALRARNIAVFAGVGRSAKAGQWKAEYSINSQYMRDLAKKYLAYTDSIRIDNTQGFYDIEGAAPLQAYINYLLNIGFKHIMINPWPVSKGGKPIPFTGIESNFVEITLSNFDRKTGQVFAASTNWQPKEAKLAQMRAFDPRIKILVNYESEPQHRALWYIETHKPGSSLEAMEITAKRCELNDWYWCPPWTKIYDPLALGTWPWIAKRLGTMHLNTAPAPATNPGLEEGTGANGGGKLTWRGGQQRATSEVHFGAVPNPPLVVASQTETAYDPGPLKRRTTYYWQIVEVNQYGKTEGPVWSFATK